jgi:hypothetical protein
VQLVLETQQYVTLAWLAMAMIILQILVHNASVIKLLQAGRAPVLHVPLDVVLVPITLLARAAILDLGSLMEFVLHAQAIKHHPEIQVNALDVPQGA